MDWIITDLKYRAEQYSCTPRGGWLSEIAWRGIPVRIKDGPGAGSYWLGKILVDPDDFETAFATYIHELRHAWQRRYSGLAGYLYGKLTGSNESDAEKEMCLASEWLGNIRRAEWLERKNRDGK